MTCRVCEPCKTLSACSNHWSYSIKSLKKRQCTINLRTLTSSISSRFRIRLIQRIGRLRERNRPWGLARAPSRWSSLKTLLWTNLWRMLIRWVYHRWIVATTSRITWRRNNSTMSIECLPWDIKEMTACLKSWWTWVEKSNLWTLITIVVIKKRTKSPRLRSNRKCKLRRTNLNSARLDSSPLLYRPSATLNIRQPWLTFLRK